jgi:hypothetical protein
VGESVSFLLVDVALTGNGSIACFGVGHAEEVVGSNSSWMAVVAGNRVINLLSFNVTVGSEELSHRSLLGLAWCLTIGGVHLSGVESLGVGLELLLLDDTVTIFHITSPELADIGGVNRLNNYEIVFKYFDVRFRFKIICYSGTYLGVTIFVTGNSNDLSSCLVRSLSVVEHGFGGSGAELRSDGEVDAAVEIVGSRWEGSLSISFAVEVLTLDSGNITSIALIKKDITQKS